ncbi:MAG: hypothetical protein DMF82_17590 [Acidobacteria bacterium]|nr:MAG: hypothetical protein DMF82_17590 [Acidobacteriota bacterium]
MKALFVQAVRAHLAQSSAARVGYEAEAAFNKALKRWTGVAPGAYRRAEAAPPARLPARIAPT